MQSWQVSTHGSQTKAQFKQHWTIWESNHHGIVPATGTKNIQKTLDQIWHIAWQADIMWLQIIWLWFYSFLPAILLTLAAQAALKHHSAEIWRQVQNGRTDTKHQNHVVQQRLNHLAPQNSIAALESHCPSENQTQPNEEQTKRICAFSHSSRL